jgi:hypothetical protein
VRRIIKVVPIALALVLLAASCSSDSDNDGGDAASTATTDGSTTSTTAAAPAGPIVFSGQGNDLVAYATDGSGDSEVLFTNKEDDPENGRDINAQICFFPDDPHRFIAGEDTNQPEPLQGWGIFDVEGDTLGDLSATQVGKLTPTYQGSADNAENYGCGFLSDGRIVTTDVGNQANGDGDGQLIVWFPPFTGGEYVDGAENAGFDGVAFCKVDVAIATAGGIYVDDEDNVYLGSARPPTSGVRRYSGDWPTGPDAAGGCGRTDRTGAPLVDEGAVTSDVFIPAGEHDLASPHSVAAAPDGGFYVSSVISGVINEYDADGAFVRAVLHPPAGEQVGPEPISTGTPLGIGVAPDGTIYYADIGIIADPENGFGPGDGTGKVRAIAFVDGEPQAPETLDEGLQFPDGIGIFQP